jgi:hypothetical protein
MGRMANRFNFIKAAIYSPTKAKFIIILGFFGFFFFMFEMDDYIPY